MSDSYQDLDKGSHRGSTQSQSHRGSTQSNPVTEGRPSNAESLMEKGDAVEEVQVKKRNYWNLINPFAWPSAVQVFVCAVLALAMGQIIRACDEAVRGKDKLTLTSNGMVLLGFFGELWMRALKGLIVPLIVTNIVCGVATLKALPGSKMMGSFAVGYYLMTTFFAACSSVIWIYLILIHVPKIEAEATDTGDRVQLSVLDIILNIFRGLVPDNLTMAALKMDLTGLIMASVVVGILVNEVNQNGERSVIINFCEETNVLIFKLVAILIKFAPIGVFSLLAPMSAVFDIVESFKSVGMLIAAVLCGHLVHACVIYPFLFTVLSWRNPIKYMFNMAPAQLTAMGTSSSAATLPVSLHCAEKKNNVDSNIAKFCLSLGATINMDGSAIHFPCAAVFCAQAQGMDVDFGQVIVIVITSTLASIGAAPIPSAGMVMLAMILESAGIPLTSTFGLVFAIDWLLDRSSTIVNVTGDGFAAGVLNTWFQKRGAIEPEEVEDTDDMYRRASVADSHRVSIIPLGAGSGPHIEPCRKTTFGTTRSRTSTLKSVGFALDDVDVEMKDM